MAEFPDGEYMRSILSNAQNPRAYGLGVLVKEIVLLEVNVIHFKTSPTAHQPNILSLLTPLEERLVILYKELDRREKEYRGIS